jgi:hypothetical protein
MPQPAPPAKGKSKMLIVGVVAVAAILVVVMLVILAAPRSSNGGSWGTTHVPEANIQYVRATYSQAVLSGDTTVSATFTNTGDAIGGAYANVRITLGSATYSAQRWVNLAPGETQSFDIVVDTPFGKSVSSSNIQVWVS